MHQIASMLYSDYTAVKRVQQLVRLEEHLEQARFSNLLLISFFFLHPQYIQTNLIIKHIKISSQTRRTAQLDRWAPW